VPLYKGQAIPHAGESWLFITEWDNSVGFMLSRGFFPLWLVLWMIFVPGMGRCAHPAIDADNTAAVIFAYHRIGDDAYPNTSLRTDQFESQMRELKDGGYRVLRLSDVIRHFQNGDTLPEKTVVLTFDGSYQSFLTTAYPVLKAYQFPFTVFINPSLITGGRKGTLTWDDVRSLKRSNLSDIGLQAGLTGSRVPLRGALNSGIAQYRDALDDHPRYFAYPFGEYTKSDAQAVAQSGFDAAFGQQSGVAYAGADRFTLPRFTLTERYGDMERFVMTANALPLPVRDITPDDPALTGDVTAIGFTLPPALSRYTKGLSCFVTGQEKTSVEPVGSGRVELRMNVPIDQPRTRVNCTLAGTPDSEGNERWRWMGMLLTLPGDAASE
jgi:peptidoglycan/xylan/chitin deacetylase (PgdA/CDA1 family)